MTRTYAHLSISAAAFQEIRQKLIDAGYQHAVLTPRQDGEIACLDMHGIALISESRKKDSGINDRPTLLNY